MNDGDPPPLLLHAESLLQQLDSVSYPTIWNELAGHVDALCEIGARRAASEGGLAMRAWGVVASVVLHGPVSRKLEALIAPALSDLSDEHRLSAGLMLMALASNRGDFASASSWAYATGVASSDAPRARLARAHHAMRTGFLDEAGALLDALEREHTSFALDVQRILYCIERERFNAAAQRLDRVTSDLESAGRAYSRALVRILELELAFRTEDWDKVQRSLDVARGEHAPLRPGFAEISLELFEARLDRAHRRLDRSYAAAKRAMTRATEWGISEAIVDSLIELAHASSGPERETYVQQLRRLVPVCARPEAVARADAALKLSTASEGRVSVAANGTWLERAGERASLARRAALRRILRALATTRTERPELDVSAVFEQGWPEEHIHPESAQRRVYTAIWQLRRLGLEGDLVFDGESYRLSDQVEIVS